MLITSTNIGGTVSMFKEMILIDIFHSIKDKVWSVWSIAWNQDSKQLAACSGDGFIQV